MAQQKSSVFCIPEGGVWGHCFEHVLRVANDNAWAMSSQSQARESRFNTRKIKRLAELSNLQSEIYMIVSPATWQAGCGSRVFCSKKAAYIALRDRLHRLTGVGWNSIISNIDLPKAQPL